MANTSDIKIGAAFVSFKGNDLGLTKGNVKLSLKSNTYPVMVDQYGETPVKEVVLSETIEVVVPLVESTVATNLLNGFGSNTGKDLLADAGQLTITPVNSGDSLNIVFSKAAPIINTDIEFSQTSERVVEITFKVFPTINPDNSITMGTINL